MLTCTSPAEGRSSPSARTPGKPPPLSRTSAAISRAASSGPRRLTLNAISGRRTPTSTPPADSRQPPRAEVGRHLPRVHAPLQLLGAAAAEERRPAPAAELPVQEHRQPRVPPPTRRASARRAPPARRSRVLRRKREHQRHHVRRPDARVRTLVTPQIDPLASRAIPASQRVDELFARAHEREDRAVVVCVGVDVEQPSPRAERLGERVDGRAVASLREVRDGLEWPRHVRSLGTVKAYYDRRAPEYDDWWRGIDRRGVSIMTADSRTRRVTHLTLNVARVELGYLCGKTEIMFRSPGWDPGRHEEVRNGPENKIHIWKVKIRVSGKFWIFPVSYRETSRRFWGSHSGTHLP